MSKILVVDDDIQLCELLTEVLEDEGHEVNCVHCGESALAYLQATGVDIILLDVMLPNIDGIQLARRICQRFATPILMLTALGDEATMFEGLQAGADHFLVKPFNVNELLIRISAILRRVGLERQRHNFTSSSTVMDDQLSRLPLTGTELDLLKYLIKHTDMVVSKAQLQQDVLKKELSPFDRNLDMHVSNIRRKMVLAGMSKQHIKTVRGRGYSYSACVAE